MTFKKLLAAQRVIWGESERGGQMPGWVEGRIEEAYDAGKKAGVANENRRLKRRLDRATFGWAGSIRSELLGVLDRGPQ